MNNLEVILLFTELSILILLHHYADDINPTYQRYY